MSKPKTGPEAVAMSGAIAIEFLLMAAITLSGAPFAECAAAQGWVQVAGQPDSRADAVQRLVLSEPDGNFVQLQEFEDTSESPVSWLELQKLIQARALASGVSWICLESGKSPWVQVPKDTFPTALKVASRACAYNALQSK